MKQSVVTYAIKIIPGEPENLILFTILFTKVLKVFAFRFLTFPWNYQRKTTGHFFVDFSLIFPRIPLVSHLLLRLSERSPLSPVLFSKLRKGLFLIFKNPITILGDELQ